jgi:hypothetical protein
LRWTALIISSDVLINAIDRLESVLGPLADLKYDDKGRTIEIAEAEDDFRRAIRLRKELNRIQDLEEEIRLMTNN